MMAHLFLGFACSRQTIHNFFFLSFVLFSSIYININTNIAYSFILFCNQVMVTDLVQTMGTYNLEMMVCVECLGAMVLQSYRVQSNSLCIYLMKYDIKVGKWDTYTCNQITIQFLAALLLLLPIVCNCFDNVYIFHHQCYDVCSTLYIVLKRRRRCS